MKKMSTMMRMMRMMNTQIASQIENCIVEKISQDAESCIAFVPTISGVMCIFALTIFLPTKCRYISYQSQLHRA